MGFYLSLPNCNYNCLSSLPLEKMEISEMDNLVYDNQLYTHAVG